MKVYYYSVIVPTIINEALTYKSENIFIIGTFVVIKLRNKLCIGLIFATISESAINFEIKEINQGLALPPLSKNQIQILTEVGHYQMEYLGTIFSIILKCVESFYKQTTSIENIVKVLNKNISKHYPITPEQLNNFITTSINLDQFLYQFYETTIRLTDIQNGALEKLNNSENKKIILLEGETGSGKTLIYLEKIKQILISNPSAQILILLPEIALTNAILKRVEEYLGIKPIGWHSNLSAKDRKESFLAVIFNIARVIVGARSAIFLPFHNLKFIVIDEEHDNSFKQDQQVLYRTIDIAKIIAKHNRDLQIILSSATPSIETIYYVKEKIYTRVALESNKSLKERMKIFVENMSSEKNKGNIISESIIERIQFYLEKNLQSMIFLNRRGYNSIIICKKCSSKLTCKNCSAGMIFHKELQKFFCSYCGFSIKYLLAKCTTCFQEADFRFYGYGVEKVYELIAEKFPNLITNDRILLLSSDNSQDLQEKIEKIENGQVDIIIGTQILAKGHNFPKLAFLGVIDGGLNFSGIDLNSAEKTYQILHQILGRLGRFDTIGECIIQTFDPKNLILQALLEQNKTKFYSYEFQQRKDFSMPPFSQLFKITFAHQEQEKALASALKFTNMIDYSKDIEIIGPSPSSIIKMNRMYRYNLMLKASHNFDLQAFLYEQFIKHKIRQSTFRIDVSPANFV